MDVDNADTWDAIRGRTLQVRTALRGRSSATPSPLTPLTERELGEAERQLGIVMPDGYRQFLRYVDSGGVGPVTMRRLVRGPEGWGWENDLETDLAGLATPFPDQHPYKNLWEEYEAAEPPVSDETAWAAWDQRGEDLLQGQTAGALYLSDDGCGFHTLLICSGAERGNVWFDRRATSDLIVPLRNPDGTHATFTDFYLDWLNAAEQALSAAVGQLHRHEIRAPIYAGRFN